MKKMKLNALAIALLLGTAVVTTSCTKENEDPIDQIIDESTTEVAFEDALLATYVKERLKLAATAKITRGDLAKLTKVDLVEAAITDVESLKGLEYATELDTINFGKTKVTDLTPLKDLKKVKYLRFHETGVTDLTPIKDYTTLTYFNANQAAPGLSSLAALEKNTNLGTLILRGNPINDAGMSVIAKFTKLHRLNARSTQIGNPTITILGDLMSKGALLKTTTGYVAGDSELDLRGTLATDFSPIQSYIDNETVVAVSK